MKKALYELQSNIWRVFSSPKRLEILDLLSDRELSVGQLTRLANIRQANLSQHLSILREKGIVKTRRDGVTIYYSLTTPQIIKVFDIIKQLLLKKLDAAEKLSQEIRKAQKL